MSPTSATYVLGWRAVDGAAVELTRTAAGDIATWTGSLAVPPVGDRPARRLVVIEEDRVATDELVPSVEGLVGRVVYADTLELR